LVYFFSHNTIKSAETSQLSNQPNSPKGLYLANRAMDGDLARGLPPHQISGSFQAFTKLGVGLDFWLVFYYYYLIKNETVYFNHS